MQDAGHVAERARFDRIDQGPGSLATRRGQVDVRGSAVAALCDMRGRTAFADIDDVTGEQRVPLGSKAACLCPPVLCV